MCWRAWLVGARLLGVLPVTGIVLWATTNHMQPLDCRSYEKSPKSRIGLIDVLVTLRTHALQAPLHTRTNLRDGCALIDQWLHGANVAGTYRHLNSS
jgi:hypothetical protein